MQEPRQDKLGSFSKANARKDEGKCPVCSAAVESGAETHPFCSTRCRKIDLGRWLSEDYVISRPIEQADLEEGVD